MGKKTKVGKQRKDNYYKLAKQKGYRSRAAFKLIQLNRKFQFLENSRVCIDLCAAPGGWLQVASEFMPVTSVILGVDLVPITPIRNVLTFQSDITTKECSETLENNLANWKADIVLHDGAPNIGKNWLHDAYGQNVLVVNALKLACNHLNKGGWFITKVFRSSDYNSLLWVFGKLFKKVHATKPQASRSESAEIFVVCQNYQKPADIDPRFFDPTFLFADISNFDETLKKQKADLLKPANKVKKAKAQGYEDGDVLKVISDVQFVTGSSHMDHLAQCHEIKLSNEDILSHTSTTEEIKECCKDLKVLGRKDLLRLLKWRRELRKDLTAKLMKAIKERAASGTANEDGDGDPDNLDHLTIYSDDDDDVETVPELQLDDIEHQQQDEKRKELRKLKKKEEKRNRDYQQRVAYGMVNQGDILIEEEHELFRLDKINGKKTLAKIDNVEPDEVVEETVDPNEDMESGKKKKSVTFSRVADVQYFELDKDYPDESEEEPDDDEPVPEKPEEETIVAPKKILKSTNGTDAIKRLNSNNNRGGGLLTDLLDVSQAKVAAAARFFDGKDFMDVDLEKEFEIDMVDKLAKERTETNELGITPTPSRDSGASTEDLSRFDAESSSSDDSEESDSEKQDTRKSKKIKLDPKGMALAGMMVSSDKARKDIEDEAWNRYAHADLHLAPKWFREEEEKYNRRNVPVDQEMMKEYKERLREIDSKPIKKVMQAKVRQKRRAMRKMEKVKKKVDAITSNEDITQRERINSIKAVYKNATKVKKKEVQLVVGRKGLPTKKPGKGKYKMVDGRMKKDLQAKARRESKGGKKGKKSSSGGKTRNKKGKRGNNSFAPNKKSGQSKMKSRKGSKSRRK